MLQCQRAMIVMEGPTLQPPVRLSVHPQLYEVGCKLHGPTHCSRSWSKMGIGMFEVCTRYSPPLVPFLRSIVPW